MSLTRRQSEVMDLLAAHPGWTDKRLAYAMTVSESRIGQLLGEVFRVYGAASRAEAIAMHRRPARRPRVPDGQLELL